MTRLFSRGMMAAVIAGLIFAAGCAQETPEQNIGPEAELFSPEKTIEFYLSSYQFGQLDGLPQYFSKELPGGIVKKYVADFAGKYEIGRFKTKRISGDEKNAVVKAVFSYTPKGKIATASSKDKYGTLLLNMVREDKAWKIRATGDPKFDLAIEDNIFLKCLKTLMDITVAQEKIRSGKDSYSSSLSELMRVVPFDEFACDELSVSQADENTFSITATTRNLSPCEITANTDDHFPTSYDECGILSLPRPAKEKLSDVKKPVVEAPGVKSSVKPTDKPVAKPIAKPAVEKAPAARKPVAEQVDTAGEPLVGGGY